MEESAPLSGDAQADPAAESLDEDGVDFIAGRVGGCSLGALETSANPAEEDPCKGVGHILAVRAQTVPRGNSICCLAFCLAC